MDGFEVWAVPLGLITNVSLLAISTSARLTSLSYSDPMYMEPAHIKLQLRRAEALALALQLLHATIIVLTLSLLSNAITSGPLLGRRMVTGGICLSVGLIVWACLALIHESQLARRSITSRYNGLTSVTTSLH